MSLRGVAIGLLVSALLPVTTAAQQMVTGRVVDEDGTPIAGVVLTTADERVRTGGDGTFLMTDESRVHELRAEDYDVARSTASAGRGVEIVLIPKAARHREHVVVTAHRQEADTLTVPGSVSVI